MRANRCQNGDMRNGAQGEESTSTYPAKGYGTVTYSFPQTLKPLQSFELFYKALTIQHL